MDHCGTSSYPTVCTSDSGNDNDLTDTDMPDLIPMEQSSDTGSAHDDNEHHTVVLQVGHCCQMGFRNDLPNDEDSNTAGILELEEDDNKLPETHAADLVADHIATVSTDGKDDDPLGPINMPALVAEWDALWGKPFHTLSKSLTMMTSPPAYLKGQIGTPTCSILKKSHIDQGFKQSDSLQGHQSEATQSA